MSDYTISIPDSLYEKAREIAGQQSRTIDEVIRTWLEGALSDPLSNLPGDAQAEVKALAYLSDDTLWTLACEQMPQAKQERVAELMDKNTHGTITESEHQELATLVEDGQRLTLRKAAAMRYLTERGYTLTADDLKPADG